MSTGSGVAICGRVCVLLTDYGGVVRTHTHTLGPGWCVVFWPTARVERRVWSLPCGTVVGV